MHFCLRIYVTILTLSKMFSYVFQYSSMYICMIQIICKLEYLMTRGQPERIYWDFFQEEKTWFLKENYPPPPTWIQIQKWETNISFMGTVRCLFFWGGGSRCRPCFHFLHIGQYYCWLLRPLALVPIHIGDRNLKQILGLKRSMKIINILFYFNINNVLFQNLKCFYKLVKNIGT